MTANPADTRRPGSALPHSRQAVSACLVTALVPASRLDATGTMWRLRSLIAMGHDSTRIARALQVRADSVRRVVRGQNRTVTPEFRTTAYQLWNAWWDKTPPRRTPAERRAATRALALAKASKWPAAAGLDEDELDQPGYRPWCRWRPALGTGIAPDFAPAQPVAAMPRGSRARSAGRANETDTAMTGHPAVSDAGDVNREHEADRPRRGEDIGATSAQTADSAQWAERPALAWRVTTHP